MDDNSNVLVEDDEFLFRPLRAVLNFSSDEYEEFAWQQAMEELAFAKFAAYKAAEKDAFILKWKHIASALKHELYDKISSAFLLMFNGDQRVGNLSEDVNDLLNELGNKKHIDHKEIDYIKRLVVRARKFKPPSINPNDEEKRVMDEIVDFILQSEKSHEYRMWSKEKYRYYSDSDDSSVDYELDCDLDDDEPYRVISFGSRYKKRKTFGTTTKATLDSWLSAYEYDSDSLLFDMECEANHSYFYQFLSYLRLQHLFPNIREKFAIYFKGSMRQMMEDVYNAHKCFLFGDYRFMDYDENEFKESVKRSEIDASPDGIRSFDLYPSFIINDDMFVIWKYFFAASYFVQKHRPKRFKIHIIPKEVVCIYDNEIIYPFHIDDIEKDLILFAEDGMKYSSQLLTKIPHNFTQNHIVQIFEKRNKCNQSMIVIIDRRESEQNKSDKMYILQQSVDSLNLTQNYSISLQFECCDKVTGCYLFYGLSHHRNRTRFFVEYLTTFIPRLFVKKQNCAQRINEIFHDSFKHGFCANLCDAKFEKYYKLITKYTHCSNNYHRDIVKSSSDNKGQVVEQSSSSKKLSNLGKCTKSNTLEIEKCVLIDYIIYSLTLFKNNDINTIDVDYLSQCYAHIINVHLFCCNAEQREKIREHVCELVGNCNNGATCRMISKHATRRENNVKTKRIKPMNAPEEVLIACLCSLHSYLLHSDNELYRLRTNDNNEVNEFDSQRFSSGHSLDPTSAKEKSDEPPQTNTNVDEKKDENVDEIDKFLQFVSEKMKDSEFVQSLNSWLIVNEYDWDSLLFDLDCYKKGKGFQQKESYFYHFLKKNNYHNLFTNINARYIDGSKVNSLNFGVCVLLWFEYGFKSKYKSLMDEALHNEYSPLDDAMMAVYKEECRILLRSNSKYTFDELLSLKMYTDESELTSKFRQSFWTNASEECQKEFYFWATTMYKTSLYHSKPLRQISNEDATPIKLYHGISAIFAVNDRSPKYFGPVSTTREGNVANNFCKGAGFRWLINSNYFNPFRLIFGMELDWISRFKNESEVLLNDQYIYIAKTVNFEKDIEKNINLLMEQLKVRKTEILDMRLFWNQIGFIIKDNGEYKMEIMIILNHPLLLKPSAFNNIIILERIVEELNINILPQFFANDKLEKIGFILPQLQKFMAEIDEKNIFWNNVSAALNADETDESMFAMLNNPLIYESSTYKSLISVRSHETNSLLYRLLNELKITKLTELKKVADKIWKHLYLHSQDVDILNELVTAQYVNAHFEHIISMMVRDPSLFVNTYNLGSQMTHRITKCLGISITKDCDISAEVKKHILLSNDELNIDESIQMPRFDGEDGSKGVLRARCKNSIVIHKDVEINGNECGLSQQSSTWYTQMNKDNDSFLKYGHWTDDNLNCNADGFGGGIIEIVSSTQNILNYGTLSCDASNYHFCGGTILINAMSKFINFGKISAMPNGRIIVKCKKYKNIGTITPEPIIINEPKPQFCQVYKPWNHFKDRDDKKIKLSIYRSNGFNADALLDGDKDTYYMSKFGLTSGDWIVFQMHSSALITKLRIRNGGHSNAIHSIAVFIGSDESPDKMYKLCQNITEIKGGIKHVQDLVISDSLLLSDNFLWQNKDKFNLLKVKILENHGNEVRNVFYEFEAFGIELC